MDLVLASSFFLFCLSAWSNGLRSSNCFRGVFRLQQKWRTGCQLPFRSHAWVRGLIQGEEMVQSLFPLLPLKKKLYSNLFFFFFNFPLLSYNFLKCIFFPLFSVKSNDVECLEWTRSLKMCLFLPASSF